MKNLFLLFALIFIANQVKAQTYSVFKGDTINRTDEKGRKQGIWKRYYTNDTLFSVATFRDGKQVQESFLYYPDGKLKMHVQFTVSGKLCPVKLYHQNSKKMATGYYSHEKKDSIWNYYNESEKISATEQYRNGLKHGKWLVYFENGKPSEETNYKNDKKHGKHIKYFPEGTIKFECSYVSDQMDGKATGYYPDGKIHYTGFYKKGNSEGDWTYYKEDGTIEYVEKFKNGISLNPRPVE